MLCTSSGSRCFREAAEGAGGRPFRWRGRHGRRGPLGAAFFRVKGVRLHRFRLPAPRRLLLFGCESPPGSRGAPPFRQSHGEESQQAEEDRAAAARAAHERHIEAPAAAAVAAAAKGRVQ